MGITSQTAASGSSQTEVRDKGRLPYRRPVLIRFGDVRDVTLGAGGSKLDPDGITQQPL